MSEYTIRHEETKGVRVFIQTMKYVVIGIGIVIVIVPLIVVLFGSFKTNKEFLSTEAFALPKSLNFANYKEAFINGQVMLGLKNTLIILVISCFGTILTGTMTAYVIQRFNTLLGRVTRTLFLAAMLLPGIAMNVSTYPIVKSLGLVETIWSVIVLYIGTDIMSIYIFVQYLNNISYSLDESALIDGAGYLRIYAQIILPLLKPAIATVLVIKSVGIYNDYYVPSLYMRDKRLAVVSTALYAFKGPYGSKWEIIFAGVIIIIIPMLCIFLFLQKYIYSGLVSGSIKE